MEIIMLDVTLLSTVVKLLIAENDCFVIGD